MDPVLAKCALGMALLASIAAVPSSGRDLAPPTGEAAARSAPFAAAMLDHSKSRWAREGQISLVDAAAEDGAVGIELPASPAPDDPPAQETTGGYTQCPASHTYCPPQVTTCPRVTTHCPVHETVCKTTECPATSTICPVEPTVCESTQCPENPTYCPSIGTLCPSIPTVCPFTFTTCPLVVTECPVFFTTCPKAPSICYSVPTVCPLTFCLPPPICQFTFDAGPPAGLVQPPMAASSTDSSGAARANQRGAIAPTVTFLPAIGD